MTAATLSRLPLAAGGTLVGSLGRGGFWTLSHLLDLGFWGASQFMRAPVAVSTIAVIVGFSALAGSNALYFQHERHPAPLFFAPAKAALPPRAAPRPLPVLPAPRPHLLPTALDLQTTGSIDQQAAGVIASTDITEMQMKLVALKLLDDKPDGIFGPRSATAVRAFEAGNGMRADGRLTPALLTAIRNAPIPAQPPAALRTFAAVVAAPAEAAGPMRPVPLAPLVAAQLVANPPVPPAGSSVAASASATPSSLPVIAAESRPVAANPPPAVAPSSADSFAANSLPPDTSTPPQPTPTMAAVAPSVDAAPALSAAQRLAAQMGTLPPDAATQAAVAEIAPGTDDSQGSTDPALIGKIQRGLASLGFLADKIDGVPGEGTAKAIRNFEVFYNYRVTGLATHQLLGLLVQHGATI